MKSSWPVCKDFHTTKLKLYFRDMSALKTHPPDTNNWEVCFNFSSFAVSYSVTHSYIFSLFSDYSNCLSDNVGSKYTQNICV